MDSDSCFQVITVFILIQCVSTDTSILVTVDECGKTVGLEAHSSIFMEYKGATLGDYNFRCVIDLVTKDPDDMICIKSPREHYLNLQCALSFRYYPNGYTSSYYYNKYHTCNDFSFTPICTKTSKASAVFRTTSLSFGNDTTLIQFYTKKYIPTTTRRWTESPWSSWSSDYDNNYDDDDDDNRTTGVVIGLTATIIGIAVVMMLCLRACANRSRAPKPQYAEPVVQYCPEPRHGNQYGNQPQNPSSQHYPQNAAAGFQQPNVYTPDTSQFPGYHIHVPVCQRIPNQGSTPNIYQENMQPPPYPEPSAPLEPPPPYPGR